MTLHTRKRILDAFFTLAEQNPTKVRFTFTDIAKTADYQDRQSINGILIMSTKLLITYMKS